MTREIVVSWDAQGAKIKGRAAGVRKIIFCTRGQQAAVCLKYRHGQKCVVVRDTAPDDPCRGALIVSPVEECGSCGAEARVLRALGAGWSADDSGFLVAPDGVPGHCLASSEIGVADAVTSYRQRVRLRELSAALTPEFIASAAILPEPPGEPALAPRPSWAEPPEWLYLARWAADKGGRLGRTPGSPYDALAEATNRYGSMAVGRGGRVGWVFCSPSYEYLSDDERGTRAGGGDLYFREAEKAEETPDEAEASRKASASPAFAEAAAHLDGLVSSRDARYAAHRESLTAWKSSLRDWWSWWTSLGTPQKVRYSLRAEGGRLCKLKAFDSSFAPGSRERTVCQVSEGDGRRARYFGPLFPHRVERRPPGVCEMSHTGSRPFDLVLENAVLADRLLVDYVDVTSDGFIAG